MTAWNSLKFRRSYMYQVGIKKATNAEAISRSFALSLHYLKAYYEYYTRTDQDI